MLRRGLGGSCTARARLQLRTADLRRLIRLIALALVCVGLRFHLIVTIYSSYCVCGACGLSGCAGIGEQSRLCTGVACPCTRCSPSPAASCARLSVVLRFGVFPLFFLCGLTVLIDASVPSLAKSGILRTLADTRVHLVPVAVHSCAAGAAVELMATRVAEARGARGAGRAWRKGLQAVPFATPELP